MDELTELEDASIFRLVQDPPRYYGTEPEIIMVVTFELNADMTLIERNNYTFVDVAADIGGLQAILAGFLSAILSIVNYNNFSDYLAENLYSINKDGGQEKDRRF